jgi:hypothetical protein
VGPNEVDVRSDITNYRPLIGSLDDIGEEVVITRYEDKDGPYRHVYTQVVARLTDGSKRDLFEVLTNVVNFWIGELHHKGLISKSYPLYRLEPIQQPIARRDSHFQLPTLEIVQGLPVGVRFLYQRYDYAKVIVEPVDLTGAKATIRGYAEAPPWEFVMSLTQDSTGRVFERVVSLTQEESKIFDILTTPDE